MQSRLYPKIYLGEVGIVLLAWGEAIFQIGLTFFCPVDLGLIVFFAQYFILNELILKNYGWRLISLG